MWTDWVTGCGYTSSLLFTCPGTRQTISNTYTLQPDVETRKMCDALRIHDGEHKVYVAMVVEQALD